MLPTIFAERVLGKLSRDKSQGNRYLSEFCALARSLCWRYFTRAGENVGQSTAFGRSARHVNA